MSDCDSIRLLGFTVPITIELTRLDTRQGVCFTPRAPSKRLDGGPNRVQRFVMVARTSVFI